MADVITIDLNADLGEGAGYDTELLSLVTSANIGCGFHAGDADITRATLLMARDRGITIGAHPGYPDREHFGRRELPYTPTQVGTLCLYQTGSLLGLARAAGVHVRFLKPHGALYNQACRDPELAAPIAAAAFVLGLALVGLPNSALTDAAARLKVPYIPEGFADRCYRSDGTLVPRTEPNAMITEVADAVTQAAWLIREVGVKTLCVHGDQPEAVAFAVALRSSLEQQGIRIAPALP